MSEPDPRAVFHAGNLPGHHSNPDTIGTVEWPRSRAGLEFMPMSGSYLLTLADGSQAECEDGFIVIDSQGRPQWAAVAPEH